MRTARVLSSAAIVTVMAAATLRADFKDFSYRCSPGTVRSCTSLQVFTTLNLSGGTDVVIRVRNLQGSAFWIPDNTGGSILTRLGIVTPPGITAASGLTVNAVGGAGTVGNPGALWSLRTPGGLGNQIELTATLAIGTNAGGIVGCSPPAGGYPATRFVTCGGTGWVEFSFTTSNPWSANNAELAWLTQDFAANGKLEECRSNSNARSFCAMVTPEPVTMLLLGSGLAGMGGFGFLRRRRRSDIEKG